MSRPYSATECRAARAGIEADYAGTGRDDPRRIAEHQAVGRAELGRVTRGRG